MGKLKKEKQKTKKLEWLDQIQLLGSKEKKKKEKT